uniref:ATP-dependent (S)-NAD(P)H-hydrate dehydratase n=1 Tax=Brugia malayi TaxID=6279 RepID=A0A0H5SAS8_BRUMA|nr:Bm14087 [Brugia malayi]
MPVLPYHVPKTLKHLNVTSALTSVQELLPQLNGNLTKGECGRIGVVGGSLIYTGAPYFSAITALKVGCDMVHVFCPAEAANVIKGYSPELMVHPSYDKDAITESLHRVDAFIVGPGLGRDEKTVSVVEFVIESARKKNIPIIVDADGLFFLAKNLNIISGYEQAILTPNHSEFNRLYQSAFKVDKIDRAKVESGEAAWELASHIGCTILQKGPHDVITNGEKLYREESVGSPRRCGGQGDLLSGALAVFSYWAIRKNDSAPTISSSVAASQLIRWAAKVSFERNGRSSTASDMIAEIPGLIRLCEP